MFGKFFFTTEDFLLMAFVGYILLSVVLWLPLRKLRLWYWKVNRNQMLLESIDQQLQGIEEVKEYLLNNNLDLLQKQNTENDDIEDSNINNKEQLKKQISNFKSTEINEIINPEINEIINPEIKEIISKNYSQITEDETGNNIVKTEEEKLIKEQNAVHNEVINDDFIKTNQQLNIDSKIEKQIDEIKGKYTEVIVLDDEEDRIGVKEVALKNNRENKTKIFVHKNFEQESILLEDIDEKLKPSLNNNLSSSFDDMVFDEMLPYDDLVTVSDITPSIVMSESKPSDILNNKGIRGYNINKSGKIFTIDELEILIKD